MTAGGNSAGSACPFDTHRARDAQDADSRLGFPGPLMSPASIPEPPDLPRFAWSQVVEAAAAGRVWVVIRNVVYDLTPWYKTHPGGTAVIRNAVASHNATQIYDSAFHG
jgi:hypothetical protein